MKLQEKLRIQKRRSVAGLAAIVLLAAAGHAGPNTSSNPAPNFSGEWKLNLSKSNYGYFPAPFGATRKIVQSGAKLSMTTIQKGAKGEITSQLNYTTDGKESANPSPNGESKGSAQWIGDKLMIESSREVQGAVLKQKEIWTLSADGKTLTIDAHVSLPNGEFDVKQVFEKQ
jgi:hypothetical protein